MESSRMFPFFKLVLAFFAGILWSKYLLLSNAYFSLCLLLITFICSLIYQSTKSASLRIGYVKSRLVFLHIFCWGLFIYSYHDFKKTSFPPENKLSSYILKSEWTKKNKYYRARASFNQPSFLKNGDLIIYCRSDSMPSGAIGDLILSLKSVHPLQPSLHPEGFDYRSFLENQGIGYTLFLNDNEFLRLTKGAYPLLRFFSRFRHHLKSKIEHSPLNEASKALIKALLLGDKSSLDNEVLSAFSIAGASHVLAVSGLHVGILVLLFSSLLSLFKLPASSFLFRTLKTTLLLLIIWTFAGVSGFSPSILRASLMFSFLSIGQNLIRHTNSYNSLSMAAFFMLFIDPKNAFNVGFQLSFLAVLGIVFFYNKIYHLLYFKFFLAQKIWSISSVSLAAQLGTFPLALYYFHLFPVYFMLSNLIVIPAAFIILFLSILLLLFSSIPIVINIISFLLNWIIEGLNSSIQWIGKIPLSSINDIYISRLEVMIILTLILFIAIFTEFKKAKYLFVILSCACLFMGLQIFDKYRAQQQKQLIIYSIPDQGVIDFVKGKEHFLFADSLSFKNPDKIIQSAENFWKKKGLKSMEDCPKYALGEIKMSNHFIVGRSHLIIEKYLICINHSTQHFEIRGPFKKKVALFMNKDKIIWDSLSTYDHIVINDRESPINNARLIGASEYNSFSNIHYLKSDGYFQIDLN